MNTILAATVVTALSLTLAVFCARAEAWYFFAFLMLLGAVVFVVVGFLIDDLVSGLVFGGLMLVEAVGAASIAFLSAPVRPQHRSIGS